MEHVIRSYKPEAPVFPNDDALADEYHTTLFGKRTLLLMDNARDLDQFEQLIPPADCVMIVTTRTRFDLTGLQMDIDKMLLEDACDLMLTTAPRVQQHAEAFAKVCNYLPEALRATASAFAERPTLDPKDFLRHMSDAQQRLKITGVDLSLTTSSELLDGESRHRWLLLSAFPDTFDDSGVAAVWRADQDAASESLSTLVRYSLLEWNSKTSRYRLHDLARDFTALQLDEATRIAA